MAIREVRIMGDDILEKQCKPVTKMTMRTKILIEDMLDTMFPKLLPLLATLGIYRLIQKKVNTNLLLLGIVICGIVLGALGIL